MRKCPECQSPLKYKIDGDPKRCVCHANKRWHAVKDGAASKPPSVPCPRCHAGPGERCRATTGGFSMVHSERRRAVEACDA